MLAVDSGFLYALADASDAWHGRALAQRHTVAEGWLTTWPVLTEAGHLLLRRIGAEPVAVLMDDVQQGHVQIWNPPPEALTRVPVLLRKYASLPMDLADASLVLLAEHLGHGRILSTDTRDFGTYHWKNRKPFKNILAETA
ncbi:MAG: VapC toxin family PIN domain ribonuclease [Rubrivivax sp.]|nr:VapC toxin family PIN domain ribonuclease [Rubrivivax sp.]